MENMYSLDSFAYFKSEKQFQKIYERFKLEGYLLEGEKFKAYFETSGQQYFDENGKEEIIHPETVIVEFYSQYIPSLIKTICDKYRFQFGRLNSKYSDNPQALYYNLNKLIEFLKSEQYFFKNDSFINQYSNVKNSLLSELDVLISDVLPSEYLQYFGDFEVDKIKFNLSKSDICFLFYFLRKEGFIEGVESNKGLSNLITKHSLERDTISNSYYLTIKDCTSELSRIKNKKILPSKKMLQFLARISQEYNISK